MLHSKKQVAEDKQMNHSIMKKILILTTLFVEHYVVFHRLSAHFRPADDQSGHACRPSSLACFCCKRYVCP